jgi:putative serine protease PepD
VACVVPGGPADRAGIAKNAVITSIDGRTITSSDDLGPAIRQHRPGDRIRVTWVDGRGTHTETVRLTTGPAV